MTVVIVIIRIDIFHSRLCLKPVTRHFKILTAEYIGTFPMCAAGKRVERFFLHIIHTHAIEPEVFKNRFHFTQQRLQGAEYSPDTNETLYIIHIMAST